MGKRSESKRHSVDEDARGLAGSDSEAVVRTFRILAAVGRWMMVFAMIIIIVGAFSYIFKFDLPQLAVDILTGVLVFGLIVSSILLLRVLWWHGSKGKLMTFNESWKLFTIKMQIFLSMIVSLLGLPTFVNLVRVAPDANKAHNEALRLVRKAKKLNEAGNGLGGAP